jgi:peptidyl-prolyl cis-trans isomerase SurA
MSIKKSLTLGIFASLSLAFICTATPAYAEKSANYIVAVVDEEAITSYDLDQRIMLMLASSQTPDSPEARKNLAPQMLRVLIDETLQRKEAEKLGIKSSDNEIESAIAQIEAQNSIPPGQLINFLASKGIDEENLRKQLEAQVTWNKIISTRIRRKVDVNDNDVEQAVEAFAERKLSDKARLAQIIRPLSKDADKKTSAAVVAEVRKISASAKNCGSFLQDMEGKAMADQANIGVVKISALPEPVRGMLSNLKTGERTPAFRTPIGAHVVMVCEREEEQVNTASKDPASRERARQGLMAQKMELEARKFMRDLRQRALIEVKV